MRLLGVELASPESIAAILQLLHNVWVNAKHQRHVHGCLQLASQQQQDVVDNQFFYDKRCDDTGGRRSDVYISHVCIKKAEVKTHSDLTSLSNEQVYELIKGMGVGWFNCYSRYAMSFRRNGINGAMLKELGDDDLEELGIDNRIHRRRIMLEVEALDEGRSWQTFDIFMCSVGFSSDTQTMKSKDEVEEMLINEIRNACTQQVMVDGGPANRLEERSPSPYKRREQGKINGQRQWSLESLHGCMGKRKHTSSSGSLLQLRSVSDAYVPDLTRSVSDASIPPSNGSTQFYHIGSSKADKWSVGEEVFYYGNGRAKAAYDGVVVKVHENGTYVKIEYDHENGSREVTPWVAEGCRVQKKKDAMKEEVCD